MTLASPLFLLVAVANWLDDKGPPFYSQWRVGRDGRRFRCLKFRTMRVDADAMMAHWKRTNDPLWQEYERCNFKLKNDPRITRAGGFLRKTSLDELPQLINILKGEMSLVGPRPIMESEIAYYGIDALNCYTRSARALRDCGKFPAGPPRHSNAESNLTCSTSSIGALWLTSAFCSKPSPWWYSAKELTNG